MEKRDIGFFEKNLTIWVLLCMIVGVMVGKFIPQTQRLLGRMEIYRVSIPTTILL